MLLQLSKTVKQSPKSPQIFENNGTFCADRPFSKNRSETNCQKSFVFNQLVSELQSYILSTTTETHRWITYNIDSRSFNRTSFQQQLKLTRLLIISSMLCSFNRTSFQQQLKLSGKGETTFSRKLQSYILSTTTETAIQSRERRCRVRLQSYILSTTTETIK